MSCLYKNIATIEWHAIKGIIPLCENDMLNRDNRSLSNIIQPMFIIAIRNNRLVITSSRIRLRGCTLENYIQALYQNLTDYQKKKYTIDQIQKMFDKDSLCEETKDKEATKIISTAWYNRKFWKNEFDIILKQYQTLEEKPTSFYDYYLDMRQIKSAEEIFAQPVNCRTKITNANIAAKQNTFSHQ